MARIVARHNNHLQAEEPRTGMISRLDCGKAPQPLTNWRAKDRHNQELELQQGSRITHNLRKANDRHDQQTRIAARHHSNSQTEEPTTGMISRLEL